MYKEAKITITDFTYNYIALARQKIMEDRRPQSNIVNTEIKKPENKTLSIQNSLPTENLFKNLRQSKHFFKFIKI